MERTLALVSDDLLMGSRVVSAAGRLGAEVVGLDDRREGTLIVIDLNGGREEGRLDELLALIRRLRAEQPGAVLLGFCGHDARTLRVAAMEAGASQVVTNGSLGEAMGRLLQDHREGTVP